MIDSTFFVKSTPLRAFTGSFSTLCRYVTDILKMCMKKFDVEKIFFDKHTGFFFNLAIFQRLHPVNNG